MLWMILSNKWRGPRRSTEANMDVNDIFKLPALPKSAVSGKRKAPDLTPASATNGDNQDPGPAAKTVRIGENGSKKAAFVSDADEAGAEDAPAAEEFAPNGDAGPFILLLERSGPWF